MRYLVVVEKGATSFGAYVPDLPGCIAAGETRDEVLNLIREAIEFHIEGLRQEGQPVPPPSSTSEVVQRICDRTLRTPSAADVLRQTTTTQSSIRLAKTNPYGNLL